MATFTGLTTETGITKVLTEGLTAFSGLVAAVIEALGAPTDFLLNENGVDFILLETGDKIGLEG